MESTLFSKSARIVASLTLIALSACGRIEDRPRISVEIGSLTAQKSVMDFLVPSAYAATGDLRLCFKRLRFKRLLNGAPVTDDDLVPEVEDQEGVEDSFDVRLGEVQVTPGLQLAEVEIPAGTYYRIEFDLDDRCGTGSSVKVQNAAGIHSTNRHVKIRFDGLFEARESGQKISLGFSRIVDSLANITSGWQIESVLESTSVKGRF